MDYLDRSITRSRHLLSEPADIVTMNTLFLKFTNKETLYDPFAQFFVKRQKF